MVIIYDGDKKRKPNESCNEFMYRICQTKEDLNRTWQEVADICNAQCNQNYSESWYRKKFTAGEFIEAPATNTYSDTSYNPNEEVDIYLEDVKAAVAELHAERVKLQDERTSRNAWRRLCARDESIVEIAREYADKMANKQPLVFTDTTYPFDSETEGILLLSDWHYGMVCSNSWNTYDPDICKKRVNKLLERVRGIIRKNNIRKVTVLNLSDLIAGRIHSQIRIESRCDVITQTMDVAEILAHFLNDLSKVAVVDYYDCLDNHSRIEPNKAESLDLESLARIIPWYLVERLKDNDNFTVRDNQFGGDIITCRVAGHNVIGVHGDNDNPATPLDKLSLLTHQHYDLCCTAHRHHFSADEQHMSMIVANASLMGVDNYSEKLRLSSHPSQTFITVTPENVCECIYRIVLD